MVAKCAAKMREESLDAEMLEALTDREISALFADGRRMHGEERLDPDYVRACDRLARIPKTAFALQRANRCDCG